jgi:hypothetical protein
VHVFGANYKKCVSRITLIEFDENEIKQFSILHNLHMPAHPLSSEQTELLRVVQQEP